MLGGKLCIEKLILQDGLAFCIFQALPLHRLVLLFPPFSPRNVLRRRPELHWKCREGHVESPRRFPMPPREHTYDLVQCGLRAHSAWTKPGWLCANLRGKLRLEIARVVGARSAQRRLMLCLAAVAALLVQCDGCWRKLQQSFDSCLRFVSLG